MYGQAFWKVKWKKRLQCVKQVFNTEEWIFLSLSVSRCEIWSDSNTNLIWDSGDCRCYNSVEDGGNEPPPAHRRHHFNWFFWQRICFWQFKRRACRATVLCSPLTNSNTGQNLPQRRRAPLPGSALQLWLCCRCWAGGSTGRYAAGRPAGPVCRLSQGTGRDRCHASHRCGQQLCCLPAGIPLSFVTAIQASVGNIYELTRHEIRVKEPDTRINHVLQILEQMLEANCNNMANLKQKMWINASRSEICRVV